MGTKLDHIKALPKSVQEKQLNYPAIPQELDFIMDHYYRIRSAAGGKISYSELNSYILTTGVRLSGFECELIMKIDRAYEAASNG